MPLTKECLMREISDPRCSGKLYLTPGINGADSSCLGAVQASWSSGTRERPTTPNHPLQQTRCKWRAAERERWAVLARSCGG